MNALDIGILAIASVFFIRGVFRGFVFELITVIGLILGYIISITYLDLLSGFILSVFPSFPEAVVKLVSFFSLFVGTNLLLRLLANFLTKTIKIAMLGWLNRLMGGILGLLKGVVIMGIIVLILNLIPFASLLLERTEVKTSLLYPLLEAFGPRLYEEIQKYAELFI
jgi:membrane protein required for colicin V production